MVGENLPLLLRDDGEVSHGSQLLVYELYFSVWEQTLKDKNFLSNFSNQPIVAPFNITSNFVYQFNLIPETLV